MNSRKHNSICALFASLALLFAAVSTGHAQKLKAEEILSKHLDSIGTAENRAALKSQLAVGTSAFTVARQANSTARGKAVIASLPNKFIVGFSFNDFNYQFERLGFNGENFNVAFHNQNNRSPLGVFLKANGQIGKDGLLGGTLTRYWALHDLESRKGKIEANGKKKIEGVETYVLSYTPRGGADFKVNLYFDAENFRHVRTEYRKSIAARMGANPDASARQSENIQVLVEDFSNFKTVKNLTLPHDYRLHMFFDGALSGTREYEWKINFSEFFLNSDFEPNAFDVEVK